MGYCTDGTDVIRSTGINLAMKGIPGVHLEGPYNMRVAGNYVNRTLAAKEEVLLKFGRLPDLVSISSCYW